MKWIQALKVWNAEPTQLRVNHRDVWAIPRKDTEPYKEVKEITKPHYMMNRAVKKLQEVEKETQERNKARKEIAEYGKPKPKEKRKAKSVNVKI